MATGPKGEKHICASCGQWHLPYRPDNCTLVPVCAECWQKTNINTRVWAICMSLMTSRVTALDQTIFEGIDGAILKLVEARAKEMDRHRNN